MPGQPNVGIRNGERRNRRRTPTTAYVIAAAALVLVALTAWLVWSSGRSGQIPGPRSPSEAPLNAGRDDERK